MWDRNMEILVYYHTYLINNYKFLVSTQIKDLFISGLYNDCKKIIIGVTYNYNNDLEWFLNEFKDYSKIEIIPFCVNNEEKSTLRLINSLKENYYICYFHTKGINNNTFNTNMWRELLQYHIIYKYKNNINLLNNGYDSVGCLYRNSPEPHFSGNYWWTTTSNIKLLDENFLNNDGPYGRFGAEFWIGTNKKSKMKCLYKFNGVEPYENNFSIITYIHENTSNNITL